VLYIGSSNCNKSHIATISNDPGVDLVFIIYSLLIGFGLGEILQLYPSLIFILQLLGSLYIVYLAYKFIRGDKKETDSNNQTFTFKDGVILQMLNPKGWTMLFLMFSTLLDGSFNIGSSNCNKSHIATISNDPEKK
jgi:threonine/homoserine/homoserine lactone efflux protein